MKDLRLHAYGLPDEDPDNFGTDLYDPGRADDAHRFRDDPAIDLLRLRKSLAEASYSVDMDVPERVANRRVKRSIVPPTDHNPPNIDRHYDFTNAEIASHIADWAVAVSVGNVAREIADKTNVVYDRDLPVEPPYDYVEAGVLDEVVLTEEQDTLFQAFQDIKLGDIIVSKSGTKGRVINFTNTKITVLYQDKNGLLKIVCLDRYADLYERRFDWIERIE